MKLLYILIQGLLFTLFIANVQSVICNGRSRRDNCRNPNFHDEYKELFCPRYYLADAIQANLRFIEDTEVSISIH